MMGTPRAAISAVAFAAALAAAAAARAEVVVVPKGATWKYVDDGSDQGTAWRAAAFDDSGWAQGPAELGYGDGDESTVVGYGPDPLNRYVTTYFRHHFTVPDPGAFLAVSIAVQRDDGAVVYLNGIEVARSNMPAGTITYLTHAADVVSDATENVYYESFAPASVLVAGANVLAVEIHQHTVSSSDISLDLELRGLDGVPGVRRGPFIQRRSESEVVVRWRTSLPTASIVHYGSAPDALTETAQTAAPVTGHALAITGLAPATRYFYEVAATEGVISPASADQFFDTAPVPSTPALTRVWVTGDSGTANLNSAAVFEAYRAFTGARRTDLWLMLGDNAYPNGSDDDYQAAVFDVYEPMLRSVALWPTLGNHDAISADSPTETGAYYDIFVLPKLGEAGGLPSGTEAYYSFDHGDIHFICLDSEDTNRAPDGAMMTWLAADLADTNASWIVAFWHHPPYSKGSHDSDDVVDSGGRMRDMREYALPILEAGGVDLVLTGHSHSYERSFLLDGHYGTSGTLTPDMIVDGGDGRPSGDGPYRKPSAGAAPNEGAVYAVAGSSGTTGGGLLNHPAMFVSLNELGSLVLDFDGMRLDATFIDDVGAVRDAFTVLKGVRDGDVDLDGDVDFADLLALLGDWGPCASPPPPPSDCPADVNGSGVVDFADLLVLLANWGP
jgi:hypothetical protein